SRWSEPHLVQASKGLIDRCPLWDDDGKAYLVHAYAASRSGIKHVLRVCPMAPDGSKLVGEGSVVFQDRKRHPTLEGPKFLKKDGWYYILAPAGGVETGWQVALRAKHVCGPYEDRIVLAQGDTDINGPHQGALVDTPAAGAQLLGGTSPGTASLPKRRRGRLGPHGTHAGDVWHLPRWHKEPARPAHRGWPEDTGRDQVQYRSTSHANARRRPMFLRFRA